MDQTQRSNRNRAKAREEARDQVRQWYILASGMNEGEGNYVEEVDETHPNGVRTFHIEPKLRKIANWIVVESPIGNSGWEIHIEKVEPVIRSFGGI